MGQRLAKVQKLIEFWLAFRLSARNSETIDHCDKHLSALYNEKYAILQWFMA